MFFVLPCLLTFFLTKELQVWHMQLFLIQSPKSNRYVIFMLHCIYLSTKIDAPMIWYSRPPSSRKPTNTQTTQAQKKKKKMCKNWNFQISEVKLSLGKQWIYPLVQFNAKCLQWDPQYYEAEILTQRTQELGSLNNLADEADIHYPNHNI